jgi:thioredoxin-like negative regulator of GroEL
MLKPKMQELAARVPITYIDVDASSSTASYYHVRNIPCIILIDEYGSEQGRLVGNSVSVQSVEQLYNK